MAGPQQYELLARDSNDFPRPPSPLTTKTTTSVPLRIIILPFRLLKRLSRPHILKRIVLISAALIVSLLSFTYFLNPSYAAAPEYTVPKVARVFIAANIVDEDYQSGSHNGLVHGPWGDSLVALAITLQSHQIPLHISVYGGPTQALSALDIRLSRLNVSRTIVAEDTQPIDLNTLPRIEIPSGEYKGQMRVKRIAYLAAVRNKAIEPLNTAETRYTHLLFLNDVVFRSSDALRLLFSTNTSPDAPDSDSESSHPNYRAACGLDFITSWKFYDSFASRDAEGYGIGVPLFPWFGSKGNAVTRQDLLNGREAVRVKSCWGGIVAFDARFFQGLLPSTPTSDAAAIETDSRAYHAWAESMLSPSQVQTLPVHFRAEPHPYWEASECCLVHADIAPVPLATSEDPDTGIYINPHVRVAYSSSVFDWLGFVQRFERLFIYPQYALNILSSMPKWNILREKAGTMSYLGDTEIFGGAAGGVLKLNITTTTVGTDVKDGFCQVRQLLLLREGKLAPGMRNWENVADVVPPIS